MEAGSAGAVKLRPARGTTTIVATVSLDDLLAKRGFGVTDAGVAVPTSDLVEQCDCRNLFIQSMNLENRTINFGRSRRHGSLDQYLALFAEEGMTSAPGGYGAAAVCDVHHILAWRHGGETDLDNLTLVDRRMHRRVDDSRSNPHRWHTLRKDEVVADSIAEGGAATEDGTSGARVAWVPPAHRDPLQRPRVGEHPESWLLPTKRGRVLKKLRKQEAPQQLDEGSAADEPP